MFIELSFFYCIHYNHRLFNLLVFPFFPLYFIIQYIEKKTDNQYTYFVFSDKKTM